MAPETKNGGSYNEKIDNWSLAIILFELLSKGRRLYQRNEVHIINKVNSQLEQII